jgi:hypothetical protein
MVLVQRRFLVGGGGQKKVYSNMQKTHKIFCRSKSSFPWMLETFSLVKSNPGKKIMPESKKIGL